ncbi:uncharacterized protein LOC126265842 [Aethina tumida]|uniref:uncharacterized protein LOC126265842 n=1 Tax=Aethina tumida TaxID=116153 RepID=UPI00214956B3|nr:uncharacterized protein LOC126265842 [Aethina tumida]
MSRTSICLPCHLTNCVCVGCEEPSGIEKGTLDPECVQTYELVCAECGNQVFTHIKNIPGHRLLGNYIHSHPPDDNSKCHGCMLEDSLESFNYKEIFNVSLTDLSNPAQEKEINNVNINMTPEEVRKEIEQHLGCFLCHSIIMRTHEDN